MRRLLPLIGLAGLILLVFGAYQAIDGYRHLMTFFDAQYETAFQQTGIATYAAAKFLLALVCLGFSRALGSLARMINEGD